jgi:hypothetical protein
MRNGLVLALSATACNQLLGIPEVERGACDTDAPFVEIAPVRGIDSELGIQSAQLTRDELTIVFSRLTVVGPGGEPVAHRGDLYTAHRDRRGDDFRDTAALEALNTELDELTASLSSDDKTLYFDRRDQAQRYQMFAVPRLATAALGEPSPLRLGDDADSYSEPYATTGALYFAARRTDGSASLFSASGHGSAFTTPQQLASLELLPSPTAYENPVVSSSAKGIYFSAPPDNASPPDIWRASRSAPGQPFGPPHAVAELNSPSAERPAWLSDDSCRLYLTTNRAGRGFELWMASRDEP